QEVRSTTDEVKKFVKPTSYSPRLASAFVQPVEETHRSQQRWQKMRPAREPASCRFLIVELVNGNAAVEQVAAVAVSIAQRDAEQSRGHQRAIGSDNGECYRPAVIGTRAGQGDGVSDLVKRGRWYLRGLEIHAGTSIAERRAARGLSGIVVIEAE